MMTTPLPLLLASASPRRRQILQLLGLPYTVSTSPADEDAAQKRFRGPAEELAQWLATHKAAEVLKSHETAGRLVITADTTVLLNGEILGKPRDKAHARHPVAPVLRRLLRRGDDLRMIRQAKVIVGAQVQHRRAARDLDVRLLRRGIAVRDCASFGLPHHIRIAVRRMGESRRLVDALAQELPRE